MSTLAGSLFREVKLLLLSFLLVIGMPPARSGGLWMPAGARQAGLDHCSVALTGFWGVENNLAGMAVVKNFSAGLGYENRFLLPHMGTASLGVVSPVKYGNLGLSLRYYGFSLFHQMKLGLTFARAFGRKLRMGVQLDYLQTGFGDIYGSRNNFSFAIGIQTDIFKKLTLGIYVFNPVPVKLAGYAKEKIPSVYRLGLAYHFSENLLATAEVEKNTENRPFVVRGGVEYLFRKQFVFRTGFGSTGDVFSFGLGWRTKNLHFDIAATMHQSLGFSPEASFVFSF